MPLFLPSQLLQLKLKLKLKLVPINGKLKRFRNSKNIHKWSLLESKRN
ncbi:hypothetical protein Pint_14774 [Pistacia integerrima]|uniref:Uncharacterized protein n=1 Tax=Pistacia integerrima TaxID=434235 RepID=A0ACC0ZGE3_9ROSI|nr:hypothetical protein Pint_14774 [Pistacia integerrima]